MRHEPWPSSLSCQRYNQKSIFRLLIRSIIKCDQMKVIVVRQCRVFYWKIFIAIFRQFLNLDYTYPNPFTPMFTVNDMGGIFATQI